MPAAERYCSIHAFFFQDPLRPTVTALWHYFVKPINPTILAAMSPLVDVVLDQITSTGDDDIVLAFTPHHAYVSGMRCDCLWLYSLIAKVKAIKPKRCKTSTPEPSYAAH